MMTLLCVKITVHPLVTAEYKYKTASVLADLCH